MAIMFLIYHKKCTYTVLHKLCVGFFGGFFDLYMRLQGDPTEIMQRLTTLAQRSSRDCVETDQRLARNCLKNASQPRVSLETHRRMSGGRLRLIGDSGFILPAYSGVSPSNLQ